MVNIHNSNVESILFIRSAEREHSGIYELVLQIENMEDRATIDIRVIGKMKVSTSTYIIIIYNIISYIVSRHCEEVKLMSV